jgi:hypothetical protein
MRIGVSASFRTRLPDPRERRSVQHHRTRLLLRRSGSTPAALACHEEEKGGSKKGREQGDRCGSGVFVANGEFVSG